MKPTTTPNMKCLVLGHNYYKDESSTNQPDKVVCKHCNSVAHIDSNGDFIPNSSKEQNIGKSMRKLFILNRTLNSGY